MRKVIVCGIVSLDGFFEGPGKNVMAMPFDAGFSAYNVQRLRSADTLLLGRTSFEGFRDYWPPVADDEAQDAIEREISRRNNAIEKVVVSDSLTLDDAGPWRDTTRIVPRADAVAAVAQLREGDGGDVLIFGSRTLWNHLLAAGQVDEVHLMVGPTAIAGGTPAFGEPAALRLLGASVLDDSQLVLLRYAPA